MFWRWVRLSPRLFFFIFRVTNRYNFKCQGPHRAMTDKDKADTGTLRARLDHSSLWTGERGIRMKYKRCDSYRNNPDTQVADLWLAVGLASIRTLWRRFTWGAFKTGSELTCHGMSKVILNRRRALQIKSPSYAKRIRRFLQPLRNRIRCFIWRAQLFQ